MVLAERIKKMFHEEGIHSTTIQPEFVELEESNSVHSADDCILDCPSNDKDGCAANTCCGANKQVKSSSPTPSSPLLPPATPPPHTVLHLGSPPQQQQEQQQEQQLL